MYYATSYVFSKKDFSRVLKFEGGYYLFDTAANRRRFCKKLAKGLTFSEALKALEEDTSPPKEKQEEAIPLVEEKQEAIKASELKKLQKHFTQKGKVKASIKEAKEEKEELYSLISSGKKFFNEAENVSEEDIFQIRKEDLEEETSLLKSFSSKLLMSAKSYLNKMEKEKLHKQWVNKENPWQQMLVLLKAQKGIDLLWLTQEEWETKKVNQLHLKAFGLRSPKLSKVLRSFGLTDKEISVLLSTSVKTKERSQVLGTKEAALEQGNSIHYSSCQATDPRAVWDSGGEFNKVEEDLQVVGKSLFFWVVGDSMKVNGEGYKARAKLRILYKEEECINVAGLYIDRPYGQEQLLLDNFDQLEDWWNDYAIINNIPMTPIFIPPVWKRDDGAGNDFQYKYGKGDKDFLYCPSACYGYQDTMNSGIGGYNFFVTKSEKESLTLQAYKARTKIGGVYMNSLTEVTYNPQKGISAPIVELPHWNAWDEKDQKFFAGFYDLFGLRPKNTRKEIYEDGQRDWYFEVNGINYVAAFYKEYSKKEERFGFSYLKDLTNHKTIIYREDCFEEFNLKEGYVLKDYPNLGYQKAVYIPYTISYNEEYNGRLLTVVSNSLYKEGFLCASYYQEWYIKDEESLEILRVTEEQVEAGFCPAWPLKYLGYFQSTVRIFTELDVKALATVGLTVAKGETLAAQTVLDAAKPKLR